MTPKKYFLKFIELTDNLKGGKINYSKSHLSNYYHLPQSLVVDKDRNLLLEKDYDIFIKD